jgi:hypothetical protein
LLAFLRAKEALVQDFIGVSTQRAKIIAFSSQKIKALSALQASIVVCVPTS